MIFSCSPGLRNLKTCLISSSSKFPISFTANPFDKTFSPSCFFYDERKWTWRKCLHLKKKKFDAWWKVYLYISFHLYRPHPNDYLVFFEHIMHKTVKSAFFITLFRVHGISILVSFFITTFSLLLVEVKASRQR